MSRVSACALGGALTLYATLWAGTAPLADDSPAPVRLDSDKIAGLNLTAIPPDAYKEILVAGELNMRVATLFEGKELRVSIFESTPAKTDHRTRRDRRRRIRLRAERQADSHGARRHPSRIHARRLAGSAGRLHRYLGDAGQLPRARRAGAEGRLALVGPAGASYFITLPGNRCVGRRARSTPLPRSCGLRTRLRLRPFRVAVLSRSRGYAQARRPLRRTRPARS